MGLDACVYCDCVEKNRLKKPHPYPRQLYVAKNGSPAIRSVDSDKIDSHDTWMEKAPCKHDEMTVASAHLGSAGFIQTLSDTLTGVASHLPPCPILMRKVLYSGTHTGDSLSPLQVLRLVNELQQLKAAELRAAGLSTEQIEPIRSLIAELNRLAKAALKLEKPIAF
jgi:hypothetical protein